MLVNSSSFTTTKSKIVLLVAINKVNFFPRIKQKFRSKRFILCILSVLAAHDLCDYSSSVNRKIFSYYATQNIDSPPLPPAKKLRTIQLKARRLTLGKCNDNKLNGDRHSVNASHRVQARVSKSRNKWSRRNAKRIERAVTDRPSTLGGCRRFVGARGGGDARGVGGRGGGKSRNQVSRGNGLIGGVPRMIFDLQREAVVYPGHIDTRSFFWNGTETGTEAQPAWEIET